MGALILMTVLGEISGMAILLSNAFLFAISLKAKI